MSTSLSFVIYFWSQKRNSDYDPLVLLCMSVQELYNDTRVYMKCTTKASESTHHFVLSFLGWRIPNLITGLNVVKIAFIIAQKEIM